MRKLKDWIKKILGIDSLERQRIAIDARLDKLEDLSMIGADLGIKDKSYLIVASKLKGGIVKVIELEPDKYNISRLLEEIEFMARKYGIRRTIKDLPRLKF